MLQEQGLLSSEQAEMVLSSQRKLRNGKEDDQVIDLALELDLISDGQAERARLIHRNHIVMGRYRPLGDVLVERRYLAEPARDALIRAVRRSKILAMPVTKVWERYVTRRNRKSDARKAEALSDSYRDQVRGFIKKGLAYRKAYRYYDAIASFEKVLGILSSNPDAERLIEETRTLLADLEQRRTRGTKLLEASLRELEYYRRLNPVDGSLGDDVAKFEERLSRLTGVARAKAQLKSETRRAPEPAPKPAAGESTKTIDIPAPKREPEDENVVTLAVDRIEDVPDELDQPAVAEDPRERAKEKVDRFLRQARRSAEAGRWDEARGKFESVLGVDPDSRAGLEGIQWCDKIAGRKRLAWVAGAGLLIAGALTATVFIIGVVETEALLYSVLGGLK
jgi:tetratricopeptide (TPR) repeat protein